MDHEERVPRRLGDAIRRAERTELPSTEALDRAVLEQARRTMRGGGEGWLGVRRAWLLGGGGALAVSALGVVWLTGVLSQPGGTGGGGGPFGSMQSHASLRGDVDGDGVVTVLDAYTVARGVEAGIVDASWDVDGDGVVTMRDADAIARIAVRLAALDVPVDSSDGEGVS